MQRFIDYVYFIKFIGITHFVYSGILLLYLIKQHIHQPFIRQWGDCIIKIGSIEQDVDFPISFKSYVCCSVGILQEAADTVIIKHMDKHTTASTIRFRLSQVSSGVDTWIKFLSIGK